MSVKNVLAANIDLKSMGKLNPGPYIEDPPSRRTGRCRVLKVVFTKQIGVFYRLGSVVMDLHPEPGPPGISRQFGFSKCGGDVVERIIGRIGVDPAIGVVDGAAPLQPFEKMNREARVKSAKACPGGV